MVVPGYNKTVAIWSSNPSDIGILTEIIMGLKLNSITCETTEAFLNSRCFIVFASGKMVSSHFFISNPAVEKKVVEGELKFVFIDDERPSFYPRNSKVVDIHNPSSVKDIILKQAKETEKFNIRREALKNKLGRIFYIYTQLIEKGVVHMDDVLDKTHITKRTFYRDMEVIKQVCPSMRIENTSGERSYVNLDCKPR